jgi:hypothetical protein
LRPAHPANHVTARHVAASNETWTDQQNCDRESEFLDKLIVDTFISGLQTIVTLRFIGTQNAENQ